MKKPENEGKSLHSSQLIVEVEGRYAKKIHDIKKRLGKYSYCEYAPNIDAQIFLRMLLRGWHNAKLDSVYLTYDQPNLILGSP